MKKALTAVLAAIMLLTGCGAVAEAAREGALSAQINGNLADGCARDCDGARYASQEADYQDDWQDGLFHDGIPFKRVSESIHCFVLL